MHGILVERYIKTVNIGCLRGGEQDSSCPYEGEVLCIPLLCIRTPVWSSFNGCSLVLCSSPALPDPASLIQLFTPLNIGLNPW